MLNPYTRRTSTKKDSRHEYLPVMPEPPAELMGKPNPYMRGDIEHLPFMPEQPALPMARPGGNFTSVDGPGYSAFPLPAPGGSFAGVDGPGYSTAPRAPVSEGAFRPQTQAHIPIRAASLASHSPPVSTPMAQGAAAPAGGAPRATTMIDILTRPEFAEDRLNRMLGSDSVYMNQARREGLLAAAARGGLNTSIAGGMATRAAIAGAQPVAMADADFTQRAFMQDRGGQITDTLGANQSLRSMDQQDNQGRLTDWLNANQAGRTDWLSANEAGRTSARMNQEADLVNQRDNIISTLRRTEQAFEWNLRDTFANNDTQRNAWLNTQSALTGSYADAFRAAQRTNLGFLEGLGQAFIDDPEVFSPEVVNGMSSFFNNLTAGVSDTALNRILLDMADLAGATTGPGPGG